MADLRIRNLQKGFDGQAIIKGIDLDVRDREFVVFVGPSGCGKSTLLRLIAASKRPAAAASPSTARTSPTLRRRSATWPWSSRPTRCTRT
ncbi:maltose ABC transporter ATP-binding protein [Pseudomonas aeruginosa]|nr:maltose ABC transporter ATP-binding protein [Pseudomonas aeruginosa]